MADKNEHSQPHVHVVPPPVYLAVLAALGVLTAVTVWVSGIHLGDPWNDVIAVGIAITKATLVVLFFMHVKYGTRMTKLAVIAAVIWLLLLLIITWSDFWALSWSPLPGR